MLTGLWDKEAAINCPNRSRPRGLYLAANRKEITIIRTPLACVKLPPSQLSGRRVGIHHAQAVSLFTLSLNVAGG